MRFKSVLLTLLVVLFMFMSAPAFAQRSTLVPTGYSTNGATGSTVSSALGTSATNVSTTAANVYGLTATTDATTSGTVVWVNVYNAAAANVVSGTTTPIVSIRLVAGVMPARDIEPWGSPIPIPFSTAVSFNCTTLQNGTVAAADKCYLSTLLKK